jgi:lipopolysaccharide transport system ATP-binding protein
MAAPLLLEHVWKAYPRWGGRPQTLRATVLRRLPTHMIPRERRWALQDVTLEVEKGQMTAIIGANGAGKSTLLRLAAGIGAPTRGRIALPDDTAAVLSLGHMFDLDATGRENAITGSLLAGMRRSEAIARIPDVLEFAELEAFADAPVRTYSEGMKLRLAFGVVAQLAPEALLLDEVLAVGDLSFQRKCIARITEMRDRGAAVLLASHSLEQVIEHCQRALWLHAGAVRALGDATDVVAQYREASNAETSARTPPPQPGVAGPLELRRNRFGSQEITIEDVRLLGPDGSDAGELHSGDGLEVRFALHRQGEAAPSPIVLVTVQRPEDGLVIYNVSTQSDGIVLGDLGQVAGVSLVFERMDLIPGDYVIDVGVYEGGWSFAYDYHFHAYPFRVVGSADDQGILRPPHRWRVDRTPRSEG